MLKVWILTDHYRNSGLDSIIGVYAYEADAKLALADYLLDPTTDTQTGYIELRIFDVVGGERE